MPNAKHRTPRAQNVNEPFGPLQAMGKKTSAHGLFAASKVEGWIVDGVLLEL